MTRSLYFFGPVLALMFSGAAHVTAQAVIAPETPRIGSPNTVTADPPVPRPHTKPCIVTLFKDLAFADFTNKSFDYSPPSDCPGRWAKVVFTADFSVTEGRQFDRTAAFYLGHANIYYGTTAEPSQTVSPHWHVERDVTDLTAIFKVAQTGEAVLGNLVNSTYTSIIYATAALEFYPRSDGEFAPRAPDVVVPIPDAPGGAVALNTTTSQLTQAVTLPTNVERVYLDIITQSQSSDEFWYTCVPNDVSTELQSCGNTAFREAEISIDNQAAGVAPVYPWIYTGGIDPYLWRPIPGVQTLNFTPYRVDLTPFAGLLSDGNSHVVALSVFNANSYFLATANLLVFTDHGSSNVSGGVLTNDLAAEPSPVVTESLTKDKNGNISGTVDVSAARNYKITGYVNTSHGRIETTVEQKIDFINKQKFYVAATSPNYIQEITQSTDIEARTIAKDGFVTAESKKHFLYPLTVDIHQAPTTTGIGITTTIRQADRAHKEDSLNGYNLFTGELKNEVESADTLSLDSSFNILGHSGQRSFQKYFAVNSLGYCYSRKITARNNILTNVIDGEGCERK